MQLREAERVGALHDEGVGVGDVQAGLDDGGAHQDVVLTVPERSHGPFQQVLRHLAVRHRDAGLRHQGLDASGGGVDGADPVVHVEHLSVAQQFAAQCGGDLFVVLRADVGQHRVALLGRGEDGRHLPDAGEAHLECARDRGGAHGQHIDVCAQRFDVLLVLDAEALLLVDHHQAKVLPDHSGLQQPVGADHDVHAAIGHAGQHRAGLGRIGEPRQPLHGHREAGHPLGEGLHVLVGQQGGGHQHRDLLAVLHSLERRAHRDLGLAVADVAAYHPVHRDGLFHIRLDLADGGQLVDGFGEPEGVLHLGLPW